MSLDFSKLWYISWERGVFICVNSDRWRWYLARYLYFIEGVKSVVRHWRTRSEAMGAYIIIFYLFDLTLSLKFSPLGVGVLSWCIQYSSFCFRRVVPFWSSGSEYTMCMIWNEIALFVCVCICMATGLSRACFISARCSFILALKVLLVSPTYCIPHDLHVSR